MPNESKSFSARTQVPMFFANTKKGIDNDCMPLLPDSLPPHPDGDRVNKVDPECIGYRSQSKWQDRYCGNCGWFRPAGGEAGDVSQFPDVSGDEHPEADGKGTIHACALVGGGIAKGGYCVAWGSFGFAQAQEEAPAEEEEMRLTLKQLREIKKRLEDS